MNYTKMVMPPMDVYKNLLNADGQQQHHGSAPVILPPVATRTKPENKQPHQQKPGEKRKTAIKRNKPHQQIVRRMLKGMSKKQLFAIVGNGKAKQKIK